MTWQPLNILLATSASWLTEFGCVTQSAVVRSVIWLANASLVTDLAIRDAANGKNPGRKERAALRAVREIEEVVK